MGMQQLRDDDGMATIFQSSAVLAMQEACEVYICVPCIARG
jgi:hypothetical protein